MAATEVNVYTPGGKKQVVEDAPKVLKELQFGVLYVYRMNLRGMTED